MGDQLDDTEDSLDIPGWERYGLIVLLILMSGLFSGLTLGLLSLDKNGLEIVIGGDDAYLKQCAEKIKPIRKNGNQLLCTLLLGNVAVNALLSILLADIAGGTVGFFVSTAVIVVFGEIVPQATCSRYALQIGARSVDVVRVFIALLYPITKPMAVILDKVLGEELGTLHTRKELIKLLSIHENRGAVQKDVAQVMEGALKIDEVLLTDIMTPVEDVYMLNTSALLDYQTILAIFRKGFSRIPVFDGDRNNIVGIVFTKDLVLVDPEDNLPVTTLLSVFNRTPMVLFDDETAHAALTKFRHAKKHMGLVQTVRETEGDPYYHVLGVVTLEDIIEEIIQGEIVDETDQFVSNTDKTIGSIRADFDWDRLRLLDSQLVDEQLTPDETSALVSHLLSNVDVFSNRRTAGELSEESLTWLLGRCLVTTLAKAADSTAGGTTPARRVGKVPESERSHHWIFHRDATKLAPGTPRSSCAVVLTGKVAVLAGKDGWRSEVGMFAVLGQDALLQQEGTYVPDFCAYLLSENMRVVYISRRLFLAACGDWSGSTRKKRGPTASPTHAPTTTHDEDRVRGGLRRANTAPLEEAPRPSPRASSPLTPAGSADAAEAAGLTRRGSPRGEVPCVLAVAPVETIVITRPEKSDADRGLREAELPEKDTGRGSLLSNDFAAI